MKKENFSHQQLDAIKRFVANPEYLEIKDAFVSHTPEGGNDGNRSDTEAKNLGKFLGTRYVFNELEILARSAPKQPENKRSQRSTTGHDPDLEG